MRKLQLLVLGCTCVATATSCWAEDGDFGLGVRGGTLGGGIEVTTPISEDTSLRFGANYMQYSFDSTIDLINYTMEPDFKNVSLMLNWHPFSGSFFVCGGAYLTNHSISVTGKARKELIPSEYAAYAYLADSVSLQGEVELDSVAPYAGIGWRSNHGEQGWGVSVDLGIMFQGSPKVSDLTIVNAPIDVSGYSEVQEYLNEEKQKIESDIEEFQYYPVASVMVNYNF